MRSSRLTPTQRAVGIWAAVLAVLCGGGALTSTLLPDLTPMIRALIVTEFLFALVLLARARWWSWAELGVNRPAVWRRPGMLALPAVLALSPLALGYAGPTEGSVLVLVVGYVLTGFTEELLWRGMVQRELAPTGPVRSVLLTAALFGTAHLANVFFRDSPALVLAQAWGAFCFGVAYGALRNRIGTIVPLMVLHAVTDLAAAVGALPKIPMLVAEDVVLLALGVVLLVKDSRAAQHTPSRPDPRLPASA